MDLYSTLRWRTTRSRAIRRDEGRCTVARFLGAGECSGGSPHVHHVQPVSEGGAPFDLENVATTCAAHHGMWEPLRRMLVERILRAGHDEAPVCRHTHRSAAARRECEARRRRRRQAHVAA